MSVVISRQGLEFLWAAALGICLGVVYDGGRALRRERQALTLPVDMLFAIVFFLALWLTSVYTRGLRLYQCLGVLLGACLYFLTVSRHFVRLFRALIRALRRLSCRLFAPLKKSMCFFQKVVKKLFQTLKKWSKIKEISYSLRPRARKR